MAILKGNREISTRGHCASAGLRSRKSNIRPAIALFLPSFEVQFACRLNKIPSGPDGNSRRVRRNLLPAEESSTFGSKIITLLQLNYGTR